ncbi:MAG: WbqC family protein [Cyclobacteriaceae bacterium]
MFKNPKWGKTVAIVQSNYIPWKGYFDLINLADAFVFLDRVQYTRRDWRNRNRIKTSQGLQWLTIPVDVKGRFEIPISEVRVADNQWASHHLKTLQHAYSKAAAYREVVDEVSAWYDIQLTELSKVNQAFVRNIMNYIEIQTPIYQDHDFPPDADKSGRLLSICEQLNASCYLSGPAAQSYLDVDSFRRSGISVRWMDYTGYRPYPQLYGEFVHEVSILDLIFNTGKESIHYLKTKI